MKIFTGLKFSYGISTFLISANIIVHPCFRALQVLRKRKMPNLPKNHPRKETRHPPIDSIAPTFHQPQSENISKQLAIQTQTTSFAWFIVVPFYNPPFAVIDAKSTALALPDTLCEIKKTRLPVLACSVSNKFVSSCSMLFELFDIFPHESRAASVSSDKHEVPLLSCQFAHIEKVDGMPGRGRAAHEVPEKRKTREKGNVFRNLTSPLGGADRGGWEAEGAREERDGNRRKRGKEGSLECRADKLRPYMGQARPAFLLCPQRKTRSDAG